MGTDLGYGGSFVPQLLDIKTLELLRDVMGPAPEQGSKWMMVDLETGKYNWYKRTTRRSYGSRGRRYGKGYGR